MSFIHHRFNEAGWLLNTAGTFKPEEHISLKSCATAFEL